MLTYLLVSRRDSDLHDDLKHNLDVSCTLSGKSGKQTLTISFRTRIEDITQRLGTVELIESSSTDDVDLFGWASQVADERDCAEEGIVEGKQKSGTAAEQIASLQGQLDDLVKAKAEHEKELIAKFASLLNEKKLQLRRLLKVLTTAKVDRRKLEEVEAGLPSPSEAGHQRGKKRQAHAGQEEEESDDSEAFAAMDVDKTSKDSDDGDAASQATSTASEAESEDDLDRPVMSQTRKDSPGPSRAAEKGSLPPPRDLPFGRQTRSQDQQQPASPPKPQQAEDDEETASEDDEL